MSSEFSAIKIGQPVHRAFANPFFPLNEYIPDGEPHVFGDRVYLMEVSSGGIHEGDY